MATVSQIPPGAPAQPDFWPIHGRAVVISFWVTFAIIFGGFVCYVPMAPREYMSTASVQIYRTTPTPLPGAGAANPAPGNADDKAFNTYVRLMQSETIAQRVANRLKSNPQELQDFLQPFQNGPASAPAETVVQRIMENVMVTPVRATLVIDVSFEHPNKEIVAKVAEYFAQEFIGYDQEVSAKKEMAIVDDLQKQLNAIQQTINDTQSKIKALVEQHPELVGPINPSTPNDAEQEYETLNHQLEDAQGNYKQQMLKLQQHLGPLRMSTANIVMVDHANVPTRPSSPRIPFLLGAGFVSGLVGGAIVAGLVAAILYARWNRRPAQRPTR